MNAEGARAEDLCAGLMRAAGLRMVERNWRCRLGEIDLIAEERGMLVFAEVRMRTGPGFGGAGESVTAAKRARLLAAARLYLVAPAGNAVPLRRVPGRRRDRRRCNGSATRLANSRAASAVRPAAQADEGVRVLVQNSPLAGFRYHAAAEVWRELRVGDRARARARAGQPARPERGGGALARPQARLRAAARERRARLGPRPRHAAARAHQRARRASRTRRAGCASRCTSSKIGAWSIRRAALPRTSPRARSSSSRRSRS